MKKAVVFVIIISVFISLYGCGGKKKTPEVVVVPAETLESAAVCGRARVTYGDETDRMGDELIASAKMLLMAEVSAKQKLSVHHRIKFYINDKPHFQKRPLYKETKTPLSEGMEVGYKALLPVFVVPGEYNVRYELYNKKQLVCGSDAIRFSTK